jgi:hypothetical protein
MRSKKGQTTVEMIVVVGLILIIFTITLLTAHRKTVESNDFKMQLDAKRIAQSVADNINTIAEQGDGYYRYFTLPPYLLEVHDYTLNIYENFVEINWTNRYGDQVWSTQIVTANVSYYCLDKGGDKRNKVFNYLENILLTCNRADLMIVEDSFEQESTTAGTSISVNILNYGVMDVNEPFNVTFTFFIGLPVWTDTQRIDGLGADRNINVNATIPSGITVGLIGDYPLYVNITEYPTDPINESYKGDNWYNATLTLT